MRLDTLHVVTKPNEHSELLDIAFAADANALALQFRGGLDPDEIYAIYTTADEALAVGRHLLAKRDANKLQEQRSEEPTDEHDPTGHEGLLTR